MKRSSKIVFGSSVVFAFSTFLVYRSSTSAEMAAKQPNLRHKSHQKAQADTGHTIVVRKDQWLLDDTVLERSSQKSNKLERAIPTTDRLAFISGFDDPSQVRVAITKIRELAEAEAPPLSIEETERLCGIIQEGNGVIDANQPAWHWIVDDVLVLIRKKGDRSIDLSDELQSGSTITWQSEISHDYALQHLGHSHEERGGSEKLESILKEEAKGLRGTAPGVALLALNRIVGNEGLLTPNDVGSISMSAFQNTKVDIRSRVSALQVAAEQRENSCLSAAIRVADDIAQPTALRMSAISAISQLGDANQKQLLSKLSHSNNERIAFASRKAINNLKK